MNRDELKKYIGITGYSLGQVEKDYFQHMILSALSKKMSDYLVFKGGTALQKIGIITRFSEDLDFTLRKELKFTTLQKNVSNVIRNYNYLNEVDNIIDDERTMAFRIKIQGPLYRNRRGICTVRIEASKREKVILQLDKREFDPPYIDILPYVIYIMQNNEILAEKIRAIYTRQKARDLYDVYRLIETGSKLDLDLTNEKLKYYDLKFKPKTFIEKCKRLKPHWNSELQSLINTIPPYNNALTNVRKILLKN